jgi:hypothetical protein
MLRGCLRQSGGQTIETVAADQRLIGQQHQHTVAGARQSRDGGADRTGDAFLPVAIDEDAGAARRQSFGDLGRICAEHDRHRASRQLGGASNHALDQRLSLEAHQLFWRAETARCAGGQHDRVQGGPAVAAHVSCPAHGVYSLTAGDRGVDPAANLP